MPAHQDTSPPKIEIINQPDFREAHNLQATGYLGRGEDGYYWAIGVTPQDVSPQQGRKDLDWRGPHAFREVAERDLIDGLRAWAKQHDKEPTDKQRAYLDSMAQTIGSSLPEGGTGRAQDRTAEIER